MIPFTRLGLQQMQMLGAGAPAAGLPRSITDIFNLLQNSPTYTGGPLTATDYEGNLVTSPAGTPALEGGRLATVMAPGITLSNSGVARGVYIGDSMVSYGSSIAALIDKGVQEVVARGKQGDKLSDVSLRIAADAISAYCGDTVIINGEFTENINGWIPGDAASLLSWADGKIQCENGDTTGAWFYQEVNVVPGVIYEITSYNRSQGTSQTRPFIGTSPGLADILSAVTTPGLGVRTFTPGVATIYVMHQNNVVTLGAYSLVDSIGVRPPTGPHFVAVQAGINDIVQGATLAGMQTDIISIVETLQASNTTPVLFNVGPYGSMPQAKKDLVVTYNEWLSGYCNTNNIGLVDVYSIVTEPGTQDLRTEYDAGDGIHLTSAGYAATVGAVSVSWYDTELDGTPIQPSISIPTRSGTKQWYQEPFANPFGYSNWPARTNLFLNSDAPVTQGITTTAQAYTISVLGTGDVTVSGTATGTATEGSPLTVTATSGTLTCTVTGTLSRVQVEAGAFASPWIETAAATVTRAATNLSNPLTLAPQMQLVVIPAATGTAGTLLDDGTNKLSYNGTNLIFTDGVTTLSGVATLTAGTAHTIGVKGLAGDWALSLDTVDLDTDATGTVVAWATAKLGRNAADGDHFAGYFPNAAGFSGADPLWYKTNLGA
jgi:hypothetical protein